MDDERSQTVDRVHHLVPPRRVHTNLLKRVSHHTFEAIVRTTPDRAPDAPPLPELEDIKDDMSEGVWGAQFNLEFAIRHIATLKTIYAGHPLARPLQNSTTLCNRATRSAAPSTQKENEYAHASPASPARATQPSTAAHYRKPLVIHRRFRNRPGRSSTQQRYPRNRLVLLPMKGPKTDADMALNFVRQDDLSDDELKGCSAPKEA